MTFKFCNKNILQRSLAPLVLVQWPLWVYGTYVLTGEEKRFWTWWALKIFWIGHQLVSFKGQILSSLFVLNNTRFPPRHEKLERHNQTNMQERKKHGKWKKWNGPNIMGLALDLLWIVMSVPLLSVLLDLSINASGCFCYLLSFKTKSRFCPVDNDKNKVGRRIPDF